jgi:predicted small secreted protein
MSISVDIPKHLLEAFKSGQLQRYGVILKDVKTGQIVGHLRETKNFIDLIGKIPANPIQMVSSLVEAGSGLAANYQLYKQNIKLDSVSNQIDVLSKQIDVLAFQNAKMNELLKVIGLASGVGAVASLATFAICISGFKAVSGRLDTIERKLDNVIQHLEEIKNDAKNREIRDYLSHIKYNYDYLSTPDISRNAIETSGHQLGLTFTKLNNYLISRFDKYKLNDDFEETYFLFNVMAISIMGELKGFALLDNKRGAEDTLRRRGDELQNFKRKLLVLNKEIALKNSLQCSQLSKTQMQLGLLIKTTHMCYEEVDSQRLVIANHIIKNQLSLKQYYEDIDDGNTGNLIKFISHSKGELQI